MSVKRRMALVAVGMAALVTVTGCGAADFGAGDDSEAGAEAPGMEAPAQREAVPAPDGGEAADEGDFDQDTGGEGGGTLIDTRSIIFTGVITLRVAEVETAAGQATTLAERHGGFVGGDSRSQDHTGSRATMVLRIPSERFTAAVDDLSGLGDEVSRQIETEDVTEEVVDLETRIATARSSVDRTRELLERADTIPEIVSVEEELSKREGRLASLQARQRALADLTTLSTITVTLLGPEVTVEEEPEPEPETGFLVGLRNGWSGFVTSMGVLLTGVGWLLPWLVALGAPVVAGWWWNRRRRGSRTTPPAVQEGAPPPASA